MWAFKIRSVPPASDTKATETARGALWAWTLLVVGVMAWNVAGIKLTDGDWANPIIWALPLVTVGSVLAAATTGWSGFVEAREQLRTR